MATFGIFSIAVALYAGYQISTIDQTYSNLIAGPSASATNAVRANRSLQASRAAMGELGLCS
jgi:methyl-accepting chemotaxis protein